MNGIIMTLWPSLISRNWCCYTTLWKSKHRKCKISAGYYQSNCIRYIIASSKWTRVIMCLEFTYMGVNQQSVHERKDSWHRRSAKMLDTNLVWLWPEHHQCWRECVTIWDHVCMLVVDTLNACSDMNVHLRDSPEHLWNCQRNLMHVTAISVVNIKRWSCVQMHFRFFDFHNVV